MYKLTSPSTGKTLLVSAECIERLRLRFTAIDTACGIELRRPTGRLVFTAHEVAWDAAKAELGW